MNSCRTGFRVTRCVLKVCNLRAVVIRNNYSYSDSSLASNSRRIFHSRKQNVRWFQTSFMTTGENTTSDNESVYDDDDNDCACGKVVCDKEKLIDCISATGKKLWDNEDNLQWHFPTKNGTGDFEVNRSQKWKSNLISETMNQPLTVCVEGNIGSGKTTFLKHFKKFPHVAVFDEPISKWRDCQGYNLLDLMYKDPRKWSLCFQSYVQLTMLDLHTKPTAQPIKMMERSIFSAQHCFVQNLRDEGLMDDPQYAVLSEWFNFSMASLPIKVDLIVYLRTDPSVSYERIVQRRRSEENSIKLEYLESIHKHHEDWLIHNPKKLQCPVLTIDANTALADMTPNYRLCEEKMFQKVAVANC